MTGSSTLRESERLEQMMDLETAAVMKERVKDVTRNGYDGRNASFMLWLFDDGNKYNLL